MAGIAAAVIAAFVGLQYYLGRQQIAEERQQRQKLIMHAADHILKPQLLVGAADSLLLLTASPTSDWDDPYVKQINSTLQVLREVRRIKKLDGTQTGGGTDLSGRTGAGPPVTSVSVNPNLDIPLIVAVAGSPPVLRFLSFGDGGRTVRWLGKMPAPEFAGGWVRARWSPDGHRIFLGGGGATAVVITPCNLSDVSPYFGELCRDRGRRAEDWRRRSCGQLRRLAGRRQRRRDQLVPGSPQRMERRDRSSRPRPSGSNSIKARGERLFDVPRYQPVGSFIRRGRSKRINSYRERAVEGGEPSGAAARVRSQPDLLQSGK